LKNGKTLDWCVKELWNRPRALKKSAFVILSVAKDLKVIENIRFFDFVSE
jgi:hypothetical protein